MRNVPHSTLFLGVVSVFFGVWACVPYSAHAAGSPTATVSGDTVTVAWVSTLYTDTCVKVWVNTTTEPAAAQCDGGLVLAHSKTINLPAGSYNWNAGYTKTDSQTFANMVALNFGSFVIPDVATTLTVSISTPVAGTCVRPDGTESVTVTWSPLGNTDAVQRWAISYWQGATVVLPDFVPSVPKTQSFYTWAVPSSVVTGSNARFKVEPKDGSGITLGSGAFSPVFQIGGCGATATAPAMPTGLIATPQTAAVQVTWGLSSGATHYTVSRELSGGGTRQTLASSVTTPSYTDTSGTASTGYIYFVRACNTSGCSADASLATSVTFPGANGGGTTPTVPTGLTTTPQSSSVYLYWTTVAQATRYEIRRELYGNSGSRIFLNNSTAPSYTDTSGAAGTGYIYFVRACTATSQCSADAASSPITFPGTATVAVPTVSIFAPAGNACLTPGILQTITWGATGDTSAVASWSISYWLADTLTQNIVSGLSAGQRTHAWNAPSTASGSMNARVKVEPKTSSGTALGTGAFSGYFQVGGCTAATAPAMPTAFSASLSTAAVTLSWNTANGATGYTVTRQAYGSSSSPQTLASNTLSLSYIDAMGGAGTTYVYAVRACNAHGCSPDATLASPVTFPGATTGTAPTVGIKARSGTALNGTFGAFTEGPLTLSATAYYQVAWTSTNATYPCIGTWGSSTQKEVNGSWDFNGVTVLGVKTYTITCSNAYGSVSDSVSVDIIAPTIANGTGNIATTTQITIVHSLTGKVTNARTGEGISGARVEARKTDTGSIVAATTDGTGSYGLSLGVGSYAVDVRPAPGTTANWTYTEGIKSIAFTKTTSAEAKQLSFAVYETSGVVHGTIRTAGGAAPVGATAIATRSSGTGGSAPVGTDGVFRLTLAEGSYTLAVYQSGVGAIAQGITFTVSAGQDLELAPLTLTDTSAHLTGIVRNAGKTVLPNIPVFARRATDDTVVRAVTGADGRYTLAVEPGEWEVAPAPIPESGYAYTGTPVLRGVAAAASASVDFTLLYADAVLSGTVTVDGALMEDFYGTVSIGTNASADDLYNGSVIAGRFSFRAKAGTYTLAVRPAPDSPYGVPTALSVVLVGGKTTQATVVAKRANAVITGTVTDGAGVPVTGIRVRVRLTQGNTTWREAAHDPATGRFRVEVPAGSWWLLADVEDATWRPRAEGAQQISVSLGGYADVRVTLERSATLMGTLQKPGGAPFPYGLVRVDATVGAAAEDVRADATGTWRVSVPPGTYAVRAFAPSDSVLQNPEGVLVTVGAGDTRTFTLTFREGRGVIRGRVLKQGGGVRAFVHAWSEKGGYAETESGDDGQFLLRVAGGDAWRVAAAGEFSGTLWQSAEHAVGTVVLGSEVLQDLTLLGAAKALPATVSRVSPASAPQAVGIVGGASIAVPPNALGSSGAITLTVVPDSRPATQAGGRVVGIGYIIEARDEYARPVTALAADAVVSLPYTAQDLAVLGAKPEALTLAYWDESAAAWRSVPGFVMDQTNRMASGAVNHLTRFALIAPADTQPPDPPSGVAVTRGLGGLVLAWTNPAYDFHHARIYRSAAAGALGTLVADNLTALTFTDTTSGSGTSTHYTVRSVDLAGNESLNTAQYTLAGSVGALSAKEKGGVAAADTVSIPAYQKYPNGSLLRVRGEQKVWIIMNGYRRYVVGPQILGFYPHLKNAPIIEVSAEEFGPYKLAAWVRYVADPKVYEVNDDATKHWLEMSAEDFTRTGRRWEAVFIVNKPEIDFYATGVNVNAPKP